MDGSLSEVRTQQLLVETDKITSCHHLVTAVKVMVKSVWLYWRYVNTFVIISYFLNHLAAPLIYLAAALGVPTPGWEPLLQLAQS